MLLSAPPREIAHAGLRALKTVALADGTFHDLERGFIESVQRHILHSDFAVDALEPITPEDLAASVPPGEFRERIIRGCVLVALMTRPRRVRSRRSSTRSRERSPSTARCSSICGAW